MFYNTALPDEGGRSSLRNVLLNKSETLRKSNMRVTSRHVTDEPECTKEKSFIEYLPSKFSLFLNGKSEERLSEFTCTCENTAVALTHRSWTEPRTPGSLQYKYRGCLFAHLIKWKDRNIFVTECSFHY